MRYKKEKKLFDRLKNKLIEDLAEYEDAFSVCDCYSEELSCDIELKVRDSHYDTLILEKKKFDSLISLAQKNNRRAIYINETPRGVYVFDLGKIQSDRDLKWEVAQLPKSTYWKKNYKSKSVFYLPVSWAIDITDKL